MSAGHGNGMVTDAPCASWAFHKHTLSSPISHQPLHRKGIRQHTSTDHVRAHLHTPDVHRARTLPICVCWMTTRHPPLAHMLDYYFSQRRRCGALERSTIEMVGTAHTCLLPVVHACQIFTTLHGHNRRPPYFSTVPTPRHATRVCRRRSATNGTTATVLPSSPRPRVSSQPTTTPPMPA